MYLVNGLVKPMSRQSEDADGIVLGLDRNNGRL
jgi:hypothetical protein